MCNLLARPDFEGFGFSMRPNDKGPHQISNVELDSPASLAGIKAEDFVLKVNDLNVAGERYPRTVALIKSQSQEGRLKLQVIEPSLLPASMRNLSAPSANSTINKGSVSRSGSINNLLSIITQARSDTDNRQRAASLNIPNRQRPISGDPQNSTIRSNMSYGSTTTAFSSTCKALLSLYLQFHAQNTKLNILLL